MGHRSLPRTPQRRLREEPRIAGTHILYSSNYNAIAWNNRHELLVDKEIRRALAMCIPVASLAKQVYQDTARGLSGPFTPDEGAYNPAVPIVPYDPTQAARVFASHGWVDSNGDGMLDRQGKSFSLEFIVIAGNAPTQSLAATLQAEWKKIGLDIKLVLLDGATAIQRGRRRRLRRSVHRVEPRR